MNNADAMIIASCARDSGEQAEGQRYSTQQFAEDDKWRC
jgi:hypothetical protein